MNVKILNIKEVKMQTSLSSSTIWRMERRGDFPVRRQISPNRVGWLQNEIEDFLAKRTMGCVAPKGKQELKEKNIIITMK